MNEQGKDYSSCRVLGFALKRAGEILEPFISDGDQLLSLIASIETIEDMRKQYPLPLYIKLLTIAEKIGYVEKLGKSAAMHSVQPLLKRDDITTIEALLKTVEREIPLQYSGKIGQFSVKVLDQTCAEIVDTTFAPCGFFISFIERTMAGFGTKNIDINHQSNNCRKHGARACKYIVTWEGNELLALTRQR